MFIKSKISLKWVWALKYNKKILLYITRFYLKQKTKFFNMNKELMRLDNCCCFFIEDIKKQQQLNRAYLLVNVYDLCGYILKDDNMEKYFYGLKNQINFYSRQFLKENCLKLYKYFRLNLQEIFLKISFSNLLEKQLKINKITTYYYMILFYFKFRFRTKNKLYIYTCNFNNMVSKIEMVMLNKHFWWSVLKKYDKKSYFYINYKLKEVSITTKICKNLKKEKINVWYILLSNLFFYINLIIICHI